MFKLKEVVVKEFASDNISDRIGDLFKRINITNFAEEHGLARKTLYKMKEKGVIPRGLLLRLCEEAEVNPILVDYSISERLFYFSCLADYVRGVSVEDLYSESLSSEKDNKDSSLLSSITFVHKMMLEGDLTAYKYQQRIQEILQEHKYVKK